MKTKPMLVKLILTYFLLIIGSSLKVLAQVTFHESVGVSCCPDQGHRISLCKDSGFFIAGQSNSFGSTNTLYEMKTDRKGDTIWTRAVDCGYGFTGQAYGITTKNGNYVAGRTMLDSVEDDIYLECLDTNGNKRWSKIYTASVSKPTSCAIAGIRQTSNGDFIVAGWCLSNSRYYVMLMKLDSVGDTVWTRSYCSSQENYLYDVEITKDGGYILCGYSNNYMTAGFYDVLVIKTDSNGNQQWAKLYGGTNADQGFKISQLASGKYIVTGCTASFGKPELYFGLIDTNGNSLWAKAYGTGPGGILYDAHQTSDKGYILAGYDWPSNNYGVLIKTDSVGNIKWSKAYDTLNYTFILSSISTLDKGIISTGLVYVNGSYDVYILKTDSSGSTEGCGEVPVSLPVVNAVPSVHNFPDTVRYTPVKILNFPETVYSGASMNNICTLTGENSADYKPQPIVFLFPDPNNGTFTLSISNKGSGTNSRIEIYNMLGEQVLNQSLSHGDETEINCTNKPAGVYLYRVMDEKGNLVGSGKFVIE